MLRKFPQRVQISRFFKGFREAEGKRPQRQLRYNRYVHHGEPPRIKKWMQTTSILRRGVTRDGQAEAVPDCFRLESIFANDTMRGGYLNRKQSFTASTLSIDHETGEVTQIV